jgi:hypothetical protein
MLLPLTRTRTMEGSRRIGNRDSYLRRTWPGPRPDPAALSTSIRSQPMMTGPAFYPAFGLIPQIRLLNGTGSWLC